MLDKDNIPEHVAIIMDGNGRWAKKRFLPAFAGHNAGMKAMIEIVRHSSDIGIGYLTVYAFSTENWKRSKEEVGGIFKLLVRYVDSQLRELNENNVKVNILGDVSVFPKDAIQRLDRMVDTTKDNTGMVFNIALNYGGRDDIRRACAAIAEEARAGRLEPEEITEDEIGKRLWTGVKGVPDPELLIRTSGEERISNFLLWQCAYSEFVFAKPLWPDFTPEEMDKTIEEYQKRSRRFGGR